MTNNKQIIQTLQTIRTRIENSDRYEQSDVDAITAAIHLLKHPESVKTGWKLVPVEPTPEMCEAAYNARDLWERGHCDNRKELHYSFAKPRWTAMLTNSPSPEDE